MGNQQVCTSFLVGMCSIAKPLVSVMAFLEIISLLLRLFELMELQNIWVWCLISYATAANLPNL